MILNSIRKIYPGISSYGCKPHAKHGQGTAPAPVCYNTGMSNLAKKDFGMPDKAMQPSKKIKSEAVRYP